MPLLGTVVLGLSAYAGYRTYDAYNGVSESDLMLANVEALASDSEGNADEPTVCPSIYDVPDHYLGYTQRTGTQKIEVEGYVIIAGKKIPVGGKVGGSVTYTYEISDCSKISKGACCPHDKVGDIKNINIIN